jgi:hypothetical protein
MDSNQYLDDLGVGPVFFLFFSVLLSVWSRDDLRATLISKPGTGMLPGGMHL